MSTPDIAMLVFVGVLLLVFAPVWIALAGFWWQAVKDAWKLFR